MMLTAGQNDLNDLMQREFCVVDFYSDTCGPCKLLAPILNRLERELPFVPFIKVNTTAYPAYASSYEINAVPTLFFVKNGEIRERHVGVLDALQIKDRIAQYLYE